MAGDFTKPTTGSLYTAFPTEIRDLCSDIVRMLESTSTLNPPTGAKRLNNGLFEEYSGAAWAEKTVGYVKKSGDTLTGRLAQSSTGFLAATKDDISTRTDSGFFQTSTATTAEGWPLNTTWMQLLACTHNNDANYNGFQLAAEYDVQRLWYRTLNNSGAQSWGEVLHGNVSARWWLAGGANRFYFAASGRSYYSSPSGHEWRNSADAATAVLEESGEFKALSNVWSNYGDAIRVGIAYTHGLIIAPNASSGGWARGMDVLRRSDSAMIGGAGWYGSNETISAFRIGMNSTWWSNYAFSVEPNGRVIISAPTSSASALTVTGYAGNGVYTADFTQTNNQNWGKVIRVGTNDVGGGDGPQIHFYHGGLSEWGFGMGGGDSYDLTMYYGGNVSQWGTLRFRFSYAGNLSLYGTNPTISLSDSDEMSAFLHCNSNYFYVLRGGVGADYGGWSTVGSGWWPLQINLSNNDMSMGGNITAAYNITAYSDERVKTDFRSAEVSLEDMLTLSPESFTRIDGGFRQIGVRAQSLQKVLPEAVLEDERGYLSANYGAAAMVMILSLSREVARLKERLNG